LQVENEAFQNAKLRIAKPLGARLKKTNDSANLMEFLFCRATKKELIATVYSGTFACPPRKG